MQNENIYFITIKILVKICRIEYNKAIAVSWYITLIKKTFKKISKLNICSRSKPVYNFEIVYLWSFVHKVVYENSKLTFKLDSK